MNKIKYKGNGKLSIAAKAAILIFILLFININAYASSNIIDEARQIIESNSVNSLSEDSTNLSSVEDMVESLSDPYAQYIPKEEYENYMNNLNDRFVGIGASISSVPEGVEIVSVFDDSPAAAAGLREGDIITAVDGNLLLGVPLGVASSYIKGEEGTVVKLNIKRGMSFFTREIVRGQVAIPTVEGEILDGHIGYIKITSFTDTTTNDFKKKLKAIKSENPNNYIIDLRDNGGGYLSGAVDIGGSFIGPLKPVVIVKDRSNNQSEYFSLESGELIDKPVIFLVNQGTASAAEILTAAVKDYDKALIIGTNTYGKGTVQGIFRLSDGSAIKMTMQTFYSPKGTPIDKVGIKPDIDVNKGDALAVARLLLQSKSSCEDKSGYVRYTIGGKNFEISLDDARQFNKWSAFGAIIESATSGGSQLYAGTSKGWNMVSEDILKERFQLYYPGYICIGELNDVTIDKTFTVTFNGEIDETSINEKSVELINARTGERIPLNFEMVNGRTFNAVPYTNMSIGQTYYLIMHTTVKGAGGGNLNQGTIVKVTVGRHSQ